MKVLVERLTYLFVVFYVGSSVYMSISFWLKDFHLNIQFCFYLSADMASCCFMNFHVSTDLVVAWCFGIRLYFLVFHVFGFSCHVLFSF